MIHNYGIVNNYNYDYKINACMFWRISADGTELEIAGATIEDAARYTCFARNLAGETEKNFDVDVHSKLSPDFDNKTSF